MLVRPVDFNGMIQNTPEVSAHKAQEDNKANVLQNNMQQTAFVKQDVSTTQVHGNQETETENLQDDDESGVLYQRNQEKRKKKKEEEKDKKKGDGVIRKKGQPVPFDIKI